MYPRFSSLSTCVDFEVAPGKISAKLRSVPWPQPLRTPNVPIRCSCGGLESGSKKLGIAIRWE